MTWRTNPGLWDELPAVSSQVYHNNTEQFSFRPLDHLNHVVGTLLASDADVNEAVASCLLTFDIRSYAPRHKSWCHGGMDAF